ncbi:MAG: DUF2330 domain-containing protein [Sandaracinus sp.]|nr:DUF2330 domain-containing protein [Sandaracinus sp.]
MNLIAFRLTKSTFSGSVRPIVLTYTGTRPMIPIRPTAMAAADDMGVMVWVLGEHRAIPTNYRHLVIDEARINWLNPGLNYDALITQAADEAGGQGFVTETYGVRGTCRGCTSPSRRLPTTKTSKTISTTCAMPSTASPATTASGMSSRPTCRCRTG